MPDTVDLGSTDQLKITLPENFYDDYAGRTAAHDQDLSIEKTMLMDYDLKMYDHDSLALKDGNISRMTASQKAQFLNHYHRVKRDYVSQQLTGKALTEWKYQCYMKDYLATTRSLDRNVGRIIDWLQENKLLENTLVIYTSDQGFYLGEHGWFDKRFMYEESMRTPLIVRYPTMIKGGSKDDHLVQNIDMAPTFLQLAGVAIPEDMQGVSILPLINGNQAKQTWRNGLYYHYYEYPGEHHVYRHFGIRTNRYKLIRFYGEKNFWELYDLKNDPSEMKNLYGNKRYKSITTDLKNQLNQLIAQYDDEEAKTILADIK
jgi:arylsulfatase A-like enzyme